MDLMGYMDLGIQADVPLDITCPMSEVNQVVGGGGKVGSGDRQEQEGGGYEGKEGIPTNIGSTWPEGGMIDNAGVVQGGGTSHTHPTPPNGKGWK